MTSKAKLSRPIEWHSVILGLALVLGSVLRILPGVLAKFPLNDGGMFLVMIRDLVNNQYRLPSFTTYNLAETPFAYPPLGFYLAAFIGGLTHLSEIELLRWLPVLFNILSIYVFYLLASAILQDHRRGALAALFYTLTPGGYGWFIMGGGLTRALGGLFLLLSVYALHRLFQFGTWKGIILTVLFCSAAVLSHPEAGLHTAASCALVWLFYGMTRRGTLSALWVASGTLALTSPWWLTLLARHGPDPFISAFHTGMYGTPPLQALLSDVFARGSMIPILLGLRVSGIGWALWRRQFFLLVWMALPYFVEPRSAPAVSFYPFNMLIALGFTDALPALIRLFRRKGQTEGGTPAFTEVRWMNLTVLAIAFYLFLESAFYTFPLVNTTLRPPSIQAMIWVRENTSPDSRFLILTGNTGAMVDPVQEWFPALAERHSQTTLQGLEWTLAEGFMPRLYDLSELQSCENAACVETWSEDTGLDFTHLFVKVTGAPESLLAGLKTEAGYKLVYDRDGFAVFER